jgi:hypothetical protein
MTRLRCRNDIATSVAITADGRIAATASLAGEVTLWRVLTGVRLFGFSCPMSVSALALTPSGDRIFVRDHGSVTVHSLTNAAYVRPIARLFTQSTITAFAVNAALPVYVLCGTARGQVAYVRTS